MRLRIFILVVVVTAIFSTKTQASELYDQAVSDYDFQINEYRKAYADYVVKKEQFIAVDSFANQEELVVSARNMLLLRGKVYEVYWQALRTLLFEAEGIDTVIRQELETTVSNNQAQLVDHQTLLSSKTTIEELMSEATWLNNLSKSYVNTAYELILNVKVARLHRSLLELEGYVPKLEENINQQIRDPQLKESKLRGVGEVANILTSARVDFQSVVDKYVLKEKRNYEAAHDDMAKELKPVFNKVRQVYQLVSELSLGTEL